MDRDQTYTTSESYISDLLTYHDLRFLHQPNAVNNGDGGRELIVSKTMLRATGHHYLLGAPKRPFVLGLTDLHQSNLFVDEDWNIKYLIGLKWVCSLPIEMRGALYCLWGHDLDDIIGANLEEYVIVRDEYMRIFEGKEEALSPKLQYGLSLAQVTQSVWEKGWVWYCLSLTSVNGMCILFDQYVCRKYHPFPLTKEMDTVVS
ncbi:hypothetical protein P152DRAFT_454687 [Eremomyces bilateralis CBS 781.70]|uniref:Aminoglycoside phosphotransferase domain-containing protein n=1 Tax=Eremomyces bilateralis CBS 781.70 TaxID=1392243 RepID=A0A6G1GEE5_9PEZI|nr:uncharacterized protein P152DRAFT_454687 [Eremomyces bilateralis CBS 781.70]KAF1816423.1 hypothetical protein P152DRAFT_454687 [Eremomyces bilateralis CBS 781.70]